MNYKKTMEEFNKAAPNLLKQFGFSESEISNCLKDIEFENKKRDEIILKLKDRYSISKYREDFPVVWYILKDEDQNIFIEHDCSRWINVYKDERYNSTSFDPLEDDCLEKITDYINTKNINI